MGKSLGNFITLDELFTGSHPLLEKAYSPMSIRFFILQAHYRSTLDFSNEALQAAERGFERLMNAVASIAKITPAHHSTVDIDTLRQSCFAAMNDDFNSPIVIANLFEGVRMINQIIEGKATINQTDLEKLSELFHLFVFEILGLQSEANQRTDNKVLSGVVDLLLTLRMDAKANKDWALSDKIRNELTALGFAIKDLKDGFEWEVKK